jgi:hypothetical protein
MPGKMRFAKSDTGTDEQEIEGESNGEESTDSNPVDADEPGEFASVKPACDVRRWYYLLLTILTPSSPGFLAHGLSPPDSLCARHLHYWY